MQLFLLDGTAAPAVKRYGRNPKNTHKEEAVTVPLPEPLQRTITGSKHPSKRCSICYDLGAEANDEANVMIWVVIFPAFFYNKKARKRHLPGTRRKTEGTQEKRRNTA